MLSINPVNDLCPDVLLVPMTTRPGPLRVPVAAPGEQTGLEVASYAKCESVGPVHKSRLRSRIGRVPKPALVAIENGVRRVLGLA